MNKKLKIKKLTSKFNNKHRTIVNKSITHTNKIKIIKVLKQEFERQKKEDKSQRNKFDRYIEHLPLTETQINVRAIHKNKTTEEIVLEKESINEIIRQIWNLPTPQNRRVYMKIVSEFSITKIAKIEKRAIPVIKRSIDRGIEKLQKNLEKFLK